MIRVPVKRELLRWARERSGRSVESLAGGFPKLEAWERGEVQPTLKQLEHFAKATFTPVGFLFLQQPPVERVPIPDLRTIAGTAARRRPSPDLLDTIYLCQQRQEWYRDWSRSVGEEPRGFVGTACLDSPVEDTAAAMRRALEFDLDARRDCRSWTEALRRFLGQADQMGVLVMMSGVVGSNNHRKLDPDEFRGFALSDNLAPLVFVNGADTKAAQMFTLAHELAHLWLGESALTDVDLASAPATQRIECWCNRVAAELLVPLAVLRDELPRGDGVAEVPRLARRFKVSTLVILRRLLDARRLSREAFAQAYDAELARVRERRTTSGGDAYLTRVAGSSRRFTRALIASTLEGQTSYRDALRMLGIVKGSTLRELGASLGLVGGAA